jgi:hypothetical protein
MGQGWRSEKWLLLVGLGLAMSLFVGIGLLTTPALGLLVGTLSALMLRLALTWLQRRHDREA